MKRTASGIMSVLLLFSMFVFVSHILPVRASGTIYIRVDGSIEPSTAPISSVDNVTYTLANDVFDSIIIERDNVVIDGDEHVVQGPGGESDGFYWNGTDNVTVKDIRVRGFFYCFRIVNSSNNIICRSNITSQIPISLDSSSNNIVSGNTISPFYYGVWGHHSSGNNISGNNIIGWQKSEGLDLRDSNNNLISENNITHNGYGGIFIDGNNNTISGNNVANTWQSIGIGIGGNYNRLGGNNITSNYYGISLHSSFSNINGNNITANCNYGIRLYSSSNNSFIANTIANNWAGIELDASSSNSIHHNNLMNNTHQVDFPGSSLNNAWNNTCEGNYWSDYNGTDSDYDGIGDIPYTIDNNTDNCPLMNPYWIPADINHDLKIDIIDVVRISLSYGCIPSDPDWNPHADIAQPFGKIDILDIVLCTIRYGEKYP